MPRPTLRLLHTSDVHIGDDSFARSRFAGLRAVVDRAIAEAVDGVLIVGDLFDSVRVRDPDIHAALEQLARLRVPTIVTPGNHDQLEPPSIYSRVRLQDAGSHIHFADERDGSHVRVESLELAVWARAMWDHSPEHRPLHGYQRHTEDSWQVALAHGHYVEDESQSHRSSQIAPTDISALECHYLALGHWHRYAEVSHDGVPAYYSGSPSEPGRDVSTANLVTLVHGERARVERRELSPRD